MSSLCESMQSCSCSRVWVCAEEHRPAVGCCCCCFRGLWGTLWGEVDLVGLSSGAQTKPVQDYPSWDKVCDYHDKTASSSPIAKVCEACWRGGPPLISHRERLNADAHSNNNKKMTKTQTMTCTLMLLLMWMCTKNVCIHELWFMKDVLTFYCIWVTQNVYIHI